MCCLWFLGYVSGYKKVKKKKKKNRHDICEDRTRAFKSKIGLRGHFTILTKTHIRAVPNEQINTIRDIIVLNRAFVFVNHDKKTRFMTPFFLAFS